MLLVNVYVFIVGRCGNVPAYLQYYIFKDT